ncbi:hypothetical protein MTR67_001932 [Solanum verrucosum]|uniref:Uncharacterized protein n=1 Tax=Solanum verrucosum TaxID=315347 RepID=A0AAF0PPH9_SOLVR|nr:hypothetical protein MTR67_001932 [Solanum verrucosum]
MSSATRAFLLDVYLDEISENEDMEKESSYLVVLSETIMLVSKAAKKNFIERNSEGEIWVKGSALASVKSPRATRAQDLGSETSELFLASWEKVSATWVLEKTSRLAVPPSFHLFQHPPTDDTKKTWIRDDARLLLQIINSIDNEVVGLVDHFCKAFYRSEKEAKSLTTYFMEFKKTYEELNVFLPFSTNIKVQHAQREQMAIMSFLAGLSSEFETAKSHIPSSSEISSLKDVSNRVLRTKSTPSIQWTNVLVAKGEGGRNNARRWNNNDAGR